MLQTADIMSTIAILQIGYALVGCLFNLFSIARVRLGRPPLSATNPYFGIVIMAAVAAVSLSQAIFAGIPYLVGWSFLVAFIGSGPVTAHFRAIRHGQNLDSYASPTAAFLAFAINAIGVVLGCIGIALSLGKLVGL